MSDLNTQHGPAGAGGGRHRQTPPSAFGEPSVWLMGSSLLACLGLVVVIVMLIASEGLSTLWPRPIERVTLRSGEVFLAIPMGSERYEPGETERERIAELVESGRIETIGTGMPVEQSTRYRFRLGNRDLGREPFRWVPEHEIVSRDRPAEAVVVERNAWGLFIGVPRAVVLRQEIEEPASAPFIETTEIETEHGPGIATRRIISETPGGTRLIARDVRLAEGPGGALAKIRAMSAEAASRRDEIDALQRHEIPSVQDRLARLTWAERGVHKAASGEQDSTGPVWLWAITSLASLGALAGWVLVMRLMPESKSRLVAVLALAVMVGGTGLHAVLERPFLRGGLTESAAAAKIEAIGVERAEAERERDELLSRIRRLERRDDVVRVEIVDPGLDRYAPIAQTQPNEPMRLSQARRVIAANTLGFWGRIRVYLARWGDFLSRPPGESPGEGGVFPVIVGTVVLTLLLTVSVVPLGVIAAIYLREYAHQGVVTSAIRIAINNLAGVPSIVYGMFGLGFFCYTMGGFIDSGPGEAALAKTPWWTLLAGLGGVVVLAGLLGVGASAPGVLSGTRTLGSNLIRTGTWWLWMAAVALAAYLIWSTPYFDGFFATKLPEQPTFGGRGILWAALTLALLTLPVVIVATEEAIAAVPGSMRQGSLGCGASRWQTVRRIVLPASMPGVLTGAILAMARGAGEVAPLMLVGAVNLAPASPVTADAPFLHGDRTFMHLGFHIYNLGFQSPDAEAARPLVWTTTLLLVAIVLVLNLAAMVIRARLPGGRGRGGL